MDLKKRLAQLDRLSRKDPKDSGGTPGVTTPDTATLAIRRAESLLELGVSEVETPAGPVWVRSYCDAIGEPTVPIPDMSEFFLQQAQPTARDLLFLDTETTGLAGGTGTIPFLVGVSWWTDQGFETRQYFLPGPGHESAMLQDLGRLAERFLVVLTFNGASFDMPLLRTRARMNRWDDPLGGLISWDLLVPSRRLYRNRLDDCRQQTLEVEICGRPRGTGDIEGSQIPQTWFDFLATGQAGLLPRVLTHNQRDMVGMARLFLVICQAAGQLAHIENHSGALPWHDGWALGRICERRRDTAGSLLCLASAVRSAPRLPGTGLGEARFLADAVRILKRGGDWKLVEQIINDGFQCGLDTIWLHREAAIMYEHRLVDLRKALDHAEKSGEDHRVARIGRLLDRRNECKVS